MMILLPGISGWDWDWKFSSPILLSSLVLGLNAFTTGIKSVYYWDLVCKTGQCGCFALWTSGKFYLLKYNWNVSTAGLRNIIDSISPQIVCIATSNTMKTSHEGENFLMNLRLFSLCPTTKMHTVISNKDLSCSCDGKSKPMTIACIVSVTFEASLTNSSLGGTPSTCMGVTVSTPLR